jgi:aminomethyltransferase
MIDFGGWDMPVEYPSTGGLVAEHKAVRASVGVFDVSHMGDIRLSGDGAAGLALAAVQHITMNDAAHLAVGQAQYSAMLYPEGSFVDDIIVHRLGDDDYLLVINAGTREKDIDWVRKNTADFSGCAVADLSDSYTQIAVQGPRAVDVMQKLTAANLRDLRSYWFTRSPMCGLEDTLIARTGYTGEDGFEIYIRSDRETSERVWTMIMSAGREFGILACGLGARNTLRLEAGLPLYGHEISESINVWEAGLGRFCKMGKSDFIGRAGLERARAAALTRALVGLEMIDRGIARDGYRCCDEVGNLIGVVTSGSPSPTLAKNIALAFVPPEKAALDTVIDVDIRGRTCKARVVATPFYKRTKTAVLPSAKTA